MTGDDDPTIRVENDYSRITIRKVRTRCGERVEIESPATGHSIRLDPMELEGLTWQPKEMFSKLHANPYNADEPDPDG